jgi:hypothetical protein
MIDRTAESAVRDSEVKIRHHVLPWSPLVFVRRDGTIAD